MSKEKKYREDKCIICKDQTSCAFNIKLELVSICEGCANAITHQQVIWLTDNQ